MKKFNAKQFRHRAIAWSLMCAIGLGSCGRAIASVSSEMDVMWNTTAAQVYSTNTSTGIYGGNFSLRMPVTSFSLVTFDPPHFNAGCSGIDMFLGSFSFLNAQEFSNLVRAIIQSAAGYLVHLAIKAICDPCESIMSKLEKIMQELNSGQMNTCKIAKTMVDTAVSASGIEDIPGFSDGAQAEINQNKLTVSGGTTDFLSSMTSVFTNGNDPTTQATSNSSTAYGNVVVNAIFTNNALATFSDTNIFGGDEGTIEVILNMFGTSVVETTPAQGYSSQGPNSQLPQPQYKPTLRFSDLINGYDGNPIPIYTCIDWQEPDPTTCQHLQETQDFKSIGFPGTLRYVVQELAGDQSSSVDLSADANADREISVINSGSILYNLQNGVALTPPQLTFLHSLPESLSTLLLDAYQASPTMSVYNEMAELASEDLAVALGQGLLIVLNSAYVPGSASAANNGKVTSPIPPAVAQARAAYAKDLVAYEGATQKDRLQKIKEIVDAIAIESVATNHPVGTSK